jgi:predicted MPP superfamily phosphohydrolase
MVVPYSGFVPMQRLAPVLFRNFWNVLALTCALGEWAVAVFVLGWRAPAPWHAGAFGALFVVNRAAALWCERERHRAPITSVLGRATLAVGFGSFLVGALMAAVGIAWLGWTLVVPPASAGSTAAQIGAWSAFGPIAEITAVAGTLVVGWGYTVGPRWTRLSERTVPVVGLPAAFDGYTIVHLSDLHLGPLLDRRYLARALDRAASLGADLVCITGDIVDSRHADLDAWIPELRRLAARDGVVAILGNHDQEADGDAVADAIARHTSVRLLRDEVATIARGDETVCIVGLEHRRPPHLTRALGSLLASLPDRATPLLLVHHPDAFPEAVSAGIPLTLAGHTHGGQLAVPFFRHLNVSHALVSSYDVGWFRTETHRLHVSAGLGSSGQHVRIGTRPEITVIRLACARAAEAA